MSLDTLVLQAMVDECGHLAGSKIVAIEQYGSNEIGLVLRGTFGRFALAVSVHPGCARVYRTLPGRKSVGSSGFLNALREHLLAGRLDHIETVPDDRVMIVHCTGRTPTGLQAYRIITEMIDRHNMMVLTTEPDLTIVQTLRRIRTGDRDPAPGERYEYPLLPCKLSLGSVTPDDIKEAGAAEDPERFTRFVTKHVGGLSPTVAREIVAGAGLLDPEGYHNVSPGERSLKLWMSLSTIADRLISKNWTPCIGEDEDGMPVMLSALPIVSLPREQVVVCDTMSEAIERYYTARLEAERLKLRDANVRRSLNEECKRLEKLVENLLHDAAVSDQEDEFRKCGELLTANLANVKFGQSEVVVKDLYQLDQGTVTIALNPAISPSDNAERYFKRARKARDGREVIEQRLLKTEKRFEKVRKVQVSVTDGLDQDVMEKAYYACIRLGLIKRDKNSGKHRNSKKKNRVEIHPRRFVTKDGSLVLVGRNNRENEILTKTASPDDIWLHARDMSGSHVILKRGNKKEMPSRWTCCEAACVAAYFSKGRGSATVPVDYTERRYVRKMKDAGPGKVIFTHEKTLFVEPKLELREEDSEEIGG